MLAKLYTTLRWLGLRPTEIYTLTTVSLRYNESGELVGDTRSRLWSWYATKQEAIESAIRGADFYSECSYYTHAVIERVKYMEMPYDRNPTWVELRLLPERISYSFQTSDGSYVDSFNEYEGVIVDRPKGTKNIVGWGIG